MKKQALSLFLTLAILLVCLPLGTLSVTADQPISKIQFAWSELPAPGESAEKTTKLPTLVGASQSLELICKFQTFDGKDVDVFSAGGQYGCFISFKADGEFANAKNIELIFNGKKVPSSLLWSYTDETNVIRINIPFYCGWTPAKTANFTIDTEGMVGKSSTNMSLTLDGQAVVTDKENTGWADLEKMELMTGTFVKGKRYLAEYTFLLPDGVFVDPLWTELSVNGVSVDINAHYTNFHTDLQPGEWFLQNVIVDTAKPLAFVNYVVEAGTKTPTASTTISTTTSKPTTTTITTQKPPVAGSTITAASTTTGAASGATSATGTLTTGTTTAPEKLVVLVQTDSATVEAAPDAFPKEAVVKLEALAADALSAPVKNALQKLAEKFVAYEITATVNGAAVQPDGTVKVTFTIPAEYDLDKVAVLYVSPDGKTETIASTIDRANGKIVAELRHFSTYVVAELDEAVVSTTTTAQTTAITDTDADTEASDDDAAPGGFPWATIIILAAVVIASGVAAWYFLLFRRK